MGSSLMDILYRVKSGNMTVADGAAGLEAIETHNAKDAAPGAFPVSTAEQSQAGSEKFEAEIGWWKYAWLAIFLAGTAVFSLGAWMISWAYPGGRMFWFYCAWLPLLLGLGVLLTGIWSRFARWVHVRIREAEGSRVSISLPVPILLASLGIRLFGSRIQGLRDQNPADIAAILTALGKTHDPISVEVDEKDGDQVRVYIL